MGEGWKVVPSRYDDGGISGGTLVGIVRAICSSQLSRLLSALLRH